MKIGFRVDANEIVATGHLMRCIAIAEQVRKQGGSCLFFLAENKCVDILENRKFEYIILDTNWEDLESELTKLGTRISDLDWLVIDSYNITKKYCERLNELVKTMVFDVPVDEVYKVSAILNYAYIGSEDVIRAMYKNESVKLMLGLMYTPLREEFFPENMIYKKEKQILVTTGGTDPYNIIYKITKKILGDKRFDEYKIVVVLGRLCQNLDRIKVLDTDRVSVLQNVNNMSELMQKSMIAFTAGGSTCLELCACRTHAVCFSFADNQIPFSNLLSKKGAITYTGDIRYNREEVLRRSCEIMGRYLNDEEYRNRIQDSKTSVCDGIGAKRVAYMLCHGEGF